MRTALFSLLCGLGLLGFACPHGARADAEAASRPERAATDRLPLHQLVQSFAVQIPNPKQRAVVSLGVRLAGDWRHSALRILHPRTPDLRSIESTLEAAIASRFRGHEGPFPSTEELEPIIDRLYAFESDSSLSAHSISAVNTLLETNGIMLAQLWVAPSNPDDPLCLAGDYEIRTRLLMGSDPASASILANAECLLGGHRTFGRWNAVFLALLGSLCLALALRLRRGWGTLEIAVHFPERTRGSVNLLIHKTPDSVVRGPVDRETGEQEIRSKRRFDPLRRFERRGAETESTFPFLPARAQPYTVTASGPLLDAHRESIIGHFFEEQRVSVRRGTRTQLLFKLRPRDCAVMVRLHNAGVPLPEGRCALRGDPASVRSTREGIAHLYLGVGRHRVVVASGDAAAEVPLEVASVDELLNLSFDFAHERCAFAGCPAAVEPFLEGDLETASEALRQSGRDRAARRLRALGLQRAGQPERAAAELEEAGDLLTAAEMWAEAGDFEGAAVAFEGAGELDRAAEAFRDARQTAEAARCYEQVRDYPNALECWRELGDRDRELSLLEKAGQFMEAATVAHERGAADRALANLQQVERRDGAFPAACVLAAEILLGRGDLPTAIAKLEEAIPSTDAASVPMATLETYAQALLRADRSQTATLASEAISRRNVERADVANPIEKRRQHKLRRTRSETQDIDAPAPSAPPMPRLPDRYEALEEIARGRTCVVYRAMDTRRELPVAIKVVSHALREDPEAAAHFKRETRGAAALVHAHIARLLDAGVVKGTHFISTELLEGKSLAAILARIGRFTPRDATRLGAQVAAGLHYAHERGILHRDLRTSKLFFTHARAVKITDFGIGRALEAVRRRMPGVSPYMAPEQIAGAEIDHRADLYALGVSLYELSTGALPFSADTAADTAANADAGLERRGDPLDPRSRVATLPPRLADLIVQLLSAEPGLRPGAASMVANQLQAAQRELEG